MYNVDGKILVTLNAVGIKHHFIKGYKMTFLFAKAPFKAAVKHFQIS